MTRVVIEYYYHVASFPDSNYVVAVHLFSWTTLEGRLKQSFNHVCNRFAPTDEEERFGLLDQKFLAAKEVFGAIFRHTSFFCDDATMAALFHTSRRPYDEVLSRAKALFQVVEARLTNQPMRFRTADDLWAATLPYTHGQGPMSGINACDPWPFVELVQ